MTTLDLVHHQIKCSADVFRHRLGPFLLFAAKYVFEFGNLTAQIVDKIGGFLTLTLTPNLGLIFRLMGEPVWRFSQSFGNVSHDEGLSILSGGERHLPLKPTRWHNAKSAPSCGYKHNTLDVSSGFLYRLT